MSTARLESESKRYVPWEPKKGLIIPPGTEFLLFGVWRPSQSVGRKITSDDSKILGAHGIRYRIPANPET